MQSSRNLFNWGGVLGLVVLLFLGSAFIGPPEESAAPAKFFLVSKDGKTINKETKLKLGDAYKAQFGKDAKIRIIELVPTKEGLWLAFQSGAMGYPTVAIKLGKGPGGMGIGDQAVSNTCTGNGCSYCTWSDHTGCNCEKDKGSCNHTQTSGFAGMKTIADQLGING